MGTLELGSRIRAIVSEQLGISESDVRSETDIIDDLGADSLDVVELVMQLEDEFDIEVPDEDAEAIRTVADVERYVAAQMS
ncbi:MAG: acyl carrier protein [Myxococcota bacterium]|jgi:acyl carrier protein|nr:acyl carrier protein [Deltaproteobacteria bacterium]MCP4240898.1 acyl carrier protein [bacterium]MDP6075527.1 acyl carrier protein [Myxococcota bacterium]MDP6243672.1 acyl carrier protein [Myxococcota bacterium]MDP7075975.1 acyl carrier protein [Myxococcota bacterium]